MDTKKGDKVRYKTIEYTEKVCECCGHEEIESEVVEKMGVIEGIEYDWDMAKGYDLDITNLPNTDGVIVPEFPQIKATSKEKFFKINGESISPKSIIEVL